MTLSIVDLGPGRPPPKYPDNELPVAARKLRAILIVAPGITVVVSDEYVSLSIVVRSNPLLEPPPKYPAVEDPVAARYWRARLKFAASIGAHLL